MVKQLMHLAAEGSALFCAGQRTTTAGSRWFGEIPPLVASRSRNGGGESHPETRFADDQEQLVIWSMNFLRERCATALPRARV